MAPDKQKEKARSWGQPGRVCDGGIQVGANGDEVGREAWKGAGVGTGRENEGTEMCRAGALRGRERGKSWALPRIGPGCEAGSSPALQKVPETSRKNFQGLGGKGTREEKAGS